MCVKRVSGFIHHLIAVWIDFTHWSAAVWISSTQSQHPVCARKVRFRYLYLERYYISFDMAVLGITLIL